MLWILLACGEGDDSGAIAPCEQEDRAVAAVEGAVFSGESTTITVTAIAPSVPAVDDNQWQLLIADSAGSVLPGCVLSAESEMPDHGHGGPTPTFVELDGGTYEMTVRFTMGGYWEVDVQTDCTGDVVRLNVCVDG